jgi:hypothetical protein
MEEMATRYGLSEVHVDYFPSREAWVPEVGDLWMVEPVQKKMASLTMVPAALASGSTSGDWEAELVYVGSGGQGDYAGVDLAGKIALGNTSVGSVFGNAVGRFGAVGALGTGSSGVNRDRAGYTLDQIGWASIPVQEGTSGFRFRRGPPASDSTFLCASSPSSETSWSEGSGWSSGPASGPGGFQGA